MRVCCIYFYPAINSMAMRQKGGDNRLTKREKEIISLLAKGRTHKQIAEELFISPHTVRKHRDNIYAKLNVSNKIEAIRKSA